MKAARNCGPFQFQALLQAIHDEGNLLGTIRYGGDLCTQTTNRY